MPTKQFGVDFDPATTPLDGTETVSIVQGGVTVDATVQDIADLGGGLENPMTTAGDMIVGGASGAPERLPIGSNGDVLSVVAGVPTWGTGGGGGAMTLIDTATVAGSAVTTVTISGLDLATDGSYHIIFQITNATASSVILSMFYNADTTATNYYNQVVVGAGTLSGARVNTGRIVESAASSFACGTIDIIREPNSGRPRAICWASRDEPASIVMQGSSHIRTNSANVTSITFSSSVASAIGIGSTFKVFKIV